MRFSLDTKKRVYVVKFRDPEPPGPEVQEQFESEDTLEIVSVLRSPLTGNQQVVTKNGEVLTWDHLRDIDYGVATVPTPNGELDIMLSFLRPLVHRSRFLGGDYVVHYNATDLFTLREGPPVTIRVLPWNREGGPRDLRHLRVVIDGLGNESDLKALEKQEMNVWDVALLTDCEQLIDLKSGLVHPVWVDIGKVVGLVPPDGLADSQLTQLLSELEEKSYDADDESRSCSDEEQEKSPEAEQPQMAFVSAKVVVERRTPIKQYRVNVTLSPVNDRKSVDILELMTVSGRKVSLRPTTRTWNMKSVPT